MQQQPFLADHAWTQPSAGGHLLYNQLQVPLDRLPQSYPEITWASNPSQIMPRFCPIELNLMMSVDPKYNKINEVKLPEADEN